MITEKCGALRTSFFLQKTYVVFANAEIPAVYTQKVKRVSNCCNLLCQPHLSSSSSSPLLHHHHIQ